MSGFFPSQRIEDPKLLFGRNAKDQILEHLLDSVTRFTNCQILGERRSGKTSLLYCLKTKIGLEYKNIICIYIDWKRNHHVKGNSNVHRYIISHCITELTKKKFFESEIELNGETIQPSKNIDSAYGKLQEVKNFKVQNILEDLLETFSEMFEISFLLLFDEFEHLFLNNLENPQGFYILRDLSEKPISKNYHPLTYVIAGATSREKLASQSGSPEWNTIGCSDFIISPIDEVAFHEMWSFYIDKLPSDKISIFKDSKYYHELSGGIPFYGKVIGQTILTSGIEPDYYSLKDNFETVLKNLNDQEVSILKKIIKGESVQKPKPTLRNLRDRGILVSTNNGDYQINGVFFFDYLKERLRDNILVSKKDELGEKVDKIETLIYEINQDSININNTEIFLCSNDDSNNFKKLKTPASEKQAFEGFCSAIYQILFERTKLQVGRGRNSRPKSLKRLPQQYQNKNNYQIIKIIDSLRQFYGGHSTNNPTYSPSNNQFDRGDLHNILLGKRTEPKHNEFYLIQLKVLDEFVFFLENIRHNR